jgi:hypothetical protein
METKTKKAYVITATQVVQQYWEYVVEAESKEEALQLVQSGNLFPDDYGIVDHDEEVIYKVQD